MILPKFYINNKYMDICEEYNNEDDIDFDNTCLVYTKFIKEIGNNKMWNNRYLNLKNGDELISNGFKELIKLTNGDINIQICTSWRSILTFLASFHYIFPSLHNK